MESSLTLTSIAALFGTMIVLAFVPSVSVLAVSARASLIFGNAAATRLINVIAGSVMVGAGVLLIVTA